MTCLGPCWLQVLLCSTLLPCCTLPCTMARNITCLEGSWKRRMLHFLAALWESHTAWLPRNNHRCKAITGESSETAPVRTSGCLAWRSARTYRGKFLLGERSKAGTKLGKSRTTMLWKPSQAQSIAPRGPEASRTTTSLPRAPSEGSRATTFSGVFTPCWKLPVSNPVCASKSAAKNRTIVRSIEYWGAHD